MFDKLQRIKNRLKQNCDSIRIREHKFEVSGVKLTKMVTCDAHKRCRGYNSITWLNLNSRSQYCRSFEFKK